MTLLILYFCFFWGSLEASKEPEFICMPPYMRLQDQCIHRKPALKIPEVVIPEIKIPSLELGKMLGGDKKTTNSPVPSDTKAEPKTKVIDPEDPGSNSDAVQEEINHSVESPDNPDKGDSEDTEDRISPTTFTKIPIQYPDVITIYPPVHINKNYNNIVVNL